METNSVAFEFAEILERLKGLHLLICSFFCNIIFEREREGERERERESGKRIRNEAKVTLLLLY